MAFEHREIISNSGDMKLDILAMGFSMLSLTFTFEGKEEGYYDNEQYLKNTLYPILEKYTYFEDRLTQDDKKELDFLPTENSKKELFEMFIRAESLGWMEHIKYELYSS